MKKPTARQASNLDSYRVILMSPRLGSPRSSLPLLSSQSESTCYVTLWAADSSLEALLTQASQAIREQLPGSHSQLDRLLQAGQADPKQLAEALKGDLSGRVRRLVLDGFDYLLADDRLAAFIGCLADGDASELQILVNSRVIDRRWWWPLLAEGKALALGADPAWASGKTQLEVCAFQGGAVFVDGRPVRDWEGPLVRDLFYFLVDHNLVTRDEIFTTFWPKLNQKEATNVFHVTKRKISQCLGFEFTDYQGGFYQHAGDHQLRYDTALFEAVIPEDEAQYQAAIRLHRGPFLYRLGMSWIRSRRQELHSRYVELLVGLARLYQASGQTSLALTYYGRARQQMPEREDLARTLMELYVADGQKAQAQAVFQQLTQVLQHDLRIQPSAQTRQVYEALQSTR